MKLKKIWKKALPYLKNKYVMSGIAFVIWLTFIDRNDFFTQYSYRKQLRMLETEKNYFSEQTEKNKADLQELMSSPANLEKFAREKYLMKKDNEEIFVLVAENKPVKK